MAEWNRELAIKNGDVTMQRYLEEVIVWNTVNHLSPAYRDNQPLVIGETWVLPEPLRGETDCKRSKSDWNVMELIDKGVNTGRIVYDEGR